MRLGLPAATYLSRPWRVISKGHPPAGGCPIECPLDSLAECVSIRRLFTIAFFNGFCPPKSALADEAGRRIPVGRLLWEQGGPGLLRVGSFVCSRIGATLDKVAIEASTPVFYTFVNMLGASVVFLILTFAYRQQHELARAREVVGTLFILGLVMALAFVAFATAFALGPTSYTLAIRSGGLLIAALWGVVLLKESLSSRKAWALTLFILGTIFLAVG